MAKVDYWPAFSFDIEVLGDNSSSLNLSNVPDSFENHKEKKGTEEHENESTESEGYLVL